MKKLSKRLEAVADALPLKNNLRILEIGCGTGALAREIANRLNNVYILGIDRSVKAIQQAIAGSIEEIKTGKLSFRQIAIENFEAQTNEEPFDIAVAVRVGALDGRHPEIEEQSLTNIAKALKINGKLFIDGGNPLKEISFAEFKNQF